MGKRPVWIFAFALLILVSLSFSSGTAGDHDLQTNTGTNQYFPETGHWVTGDFLSTYNSVPDPTKVFGYPITDAFQNQTTELIVQYFERAHFELHPENPPELRVRQTLLGEILQKPGNVLSIPPNFPACRFFPETGRQVCYSFLDFFEANGGIAQFGYPISDVEFQEGRIVQYFQRALFEWHPELAPGESVVLANLGREYFDARREDSYHLLAKRENYIPQNVLNIQARAFPLSAVVPLRGQQEFYVIVQDQNLIPIQNAQVSLTIRYPSGTTAEEQMAPTDQNGITSYLFLLNETEYGVAEVLIEVSYNNFKTETSSSFRLWW